MMLFGRVVFVLVFLFFFRDQQGKLIDGGEK